MGFGPISNLKSKIMWVATVLCLGLMISFSEEAHAGQCEDLEPKTDSACNNPNDTTTGDESGRMTGLTEQMRAAGQNTGGIGNNQSNQCENQQKVQNLSRELSQLKGQACQNMITKCSEACEKEASDAEKKRDFQTAQKKRQAKSRCEQNSGNVAKAAQQAGQNANNAQTNATCNQQSSQQPQMPPPQQQQNEQKPSQASATPTPPPVPQMGEPDTSKALGVYGGGESSSVAGSSTSSETPGTSSSSLVEGSGTSSSPGGSVSSGSVGSFGSMGGATQAAIADRKPQDEGKDSSLGKSLAEGGGGGGGRGGGGAPGEMPYDPQLLERIKNKGLGGMTVKAVDGITGPMGASLFEKVSNQYKRQMSIFLPE